MKKTNMQIINDDGELCIHLAKIASDILLDIQQTTSICGPDLGKIADKAANDAILSELKIHRPNDAILSEESVDDLARLNAKRVWIIDPLDGTLEYSQKRDDWAVHIGLAIDTIAKIGAVAIPAVNEIYSTINRIDKQINPNRKKPIIIASRSRPVEKLEILAQYLGAEIQTAGSAGYKAVKIIKGSADIYFHTGGQSEWDNCAPIAVARAFGLYAGDIFGNEIEYNKSDVLVPNLLICASEYQKSISEWAKNNLL